MTGEPPAVVEDLAGRPGPPSRLTLIREYYARQGAYLSVLAAAWTASALVLAVLFGLSLFEKVRTQGPVWLGAGVLVAALLWALFVVEGAELATMSLLDKDLEQISDPPARGVLESVHRRWASFFNGRQSVVITCIVTLTLAVGDVARLPGPRPGPGSGLGHHDALASILHSGVTQIVLTFAFPNFIVLWVSQLYPKLLAAREPLARFCLPSHLLWIKLAMAIERYTNIGAPTSVIGIARHRLLLDAGSQAQLAPSRREMYRSLATFNYRTGVEHVSTTITVDGDGSVRAIERKTMRIYVGGTTLLRTAHTQHAAIDPASVALTVACESGSGSPAPDGFQRITVGPAARNGNANGSCVWAMVSFPDPLNDGDLVRQELSYRTTAGAFAMGDQQVEAYRISITRPTQEFELFIYPEDEDRFVFTDGTCTLLWTDQHNHESGFFDEEQRRCRVTSYRRGYRLRVDHPTVGTQLVMSWQVNDRQYESKALGAGGSRSRPFTR